MTGHRRQPARLDRSRCREAAEACPEAPDALLGVEHRLAVSVRPLRLGGETVREDPVARRACRSAPGTRTPAAVRRSRTRRWRWVPNRPPPRSASRRDRARGTGRPVLDARRSAGALAGKAGGCRARVEYGADGVPHRSLPFFEPSRVFGRVPDATRGRGDGDWDRDHKTRREGADEVYAGPASGQLQSGRPPSAQLRRTRPALSGHSAGRRTAGTTTRSTWAPGRKEPCRSWDGCSELPPRFVIPARSVRARGCVDCARHHAEPAGFVGSITCGTVVKWAQSRRRTSWASWAPV